MKCSELMQREIECCRAHDRIDVVAQRMRDIGVGFLPVCAEDDTVIGVVTDRDIVLRVLAERLNAQATRVDEIMTRGVVSCRSTDDLAVAEDLMARYQKSRILCLDDRGRSVGVISLADIAQIEGPVRAAQLFGTIVTRETEIRASAR